MSYGRAVSARGSALAAVSRAARKKWRRSAVSNEEDVDWRCFSLSENGGPSGGLLPNAALSAAEP